MKIYTKDRLMFLYLNIIGYCLNKWIVEKSLCYYHQITPKFSNLKQQTYYLIQFLKVRNQKWLSCNSKLFLVKFCLLSKCIGYDNSGIYIRSRSLAELQWKVFDKNTIVHLIGILEQKVSKANCLHFLTGMESSERSHWDLQE